MANFDFLTSMALFGADTLLGCFRLAQRRMLLVDRPPSTARFVDIASRLWASDLSLSRHLQNTIQDAKHNRMQSDDPPIHWKGVLNMKDPFSLACYPLLIQELRPRTVIELGSYSGGSALWIADLLEIFGLTETHVHSFDINLKRIQVADPRITFHEADSRRVESFDSGLIGSWDHPWLFIDDAHQNLHGVLSYFHEFFRAGDYIVVEDTRLHPLHLAMKRFLTDRQGQYLVDARYADLFGYNATWNINGYIRRMHD